VSEPNRSVLDAVFALPGRSTRAIVDLDMLMANVRELVRLAGDRTALIAVVKASGYGHGAVMAARAALAAGAAMLGVATVGEAAALRAHDVSAPILLLGPCDPSEYDRAIALGIDFTIGSSSGLEAILEATSRLDVRTRVHLKIDTGMHRFGFVPADVVSAAMQLAGSERIDLVALCSHLAAADDPNHIANVQQPAIFEHVAAQISAQIGHHVPLHIANSAGILNGISVGAAYVRTGIAMYGLRPGPGTTIPDPIRPVISVVSRIARVHRAPAGAGVSYGHVYMAESDEILGLVPIGYADGYRRTWSNRATVGVAGSRLPVRGRICMDQIILGALPRSVTEGAVVGLFGPLGGGPSVDDLADLADTINYEIVTGLPQRVPRYFVSEGRVVATLIEDRLSLI
jgi:alanine racemase